MARKSDLAKTVATYQKTAIESQKMWLSASEVIWRRSMQMAMGTMTPVEAAQMVFEKPAAFAKATEKAAVAAAGNKGAATALAAFLTPIGTKAGSNAKRLRKR